MLKLFLTTRLLDGKFLWKRIASTLLVPQNAHDPPAVAVIEQLNAVDAASEGRLSGSVPGFIAAKNLRDVSIGLNATHDGALEEGVLREVIASQPDVIFDTHGVDSNNTIPAFAPGG